MRKELIWVGVIGIIFGLAIGFGVWRIRTSVVPQNDSSISLTPQPKADQQFKIAVNKPDNLEVVSQSIVKVSGITKPQSWVVVSAREKDYLAESRDDGTFLIDVDLKPGLNHIKTASVNNQGDSASQDLLVVYSESFRTDTINPGSTSDEQDLEKEIADKMERVSNPARAYLGTVTDITDTTIQIKSIDSQIQQIATNKTDVVVVNMTETSGKTVKLTDIAIGDFIIAMGYVNGNSVLDTRRILITDNKPVPKINLSLAKVSEILKNTLKATTIKNDEEIVITPDKNTQLKSYSENKTKNMSLTGMKIDDLLIVVSDNSGTPTITRSVFNITSK